ncbi:MAG TPA: J domain-containing protein [Leptospiraceae bacterium]|nr:J domain-containing protein [Leptospiraceae bacterium]HMW05741.1 J domain-containing protein [Leptospiraceae bacterium]HMX32492.1 J domain-containing protein [Leptospiraceae bacterium]HMY30226.1 J domain-containing protein [Leptospiraceae bacterium]HMZ66931.1 J domain-containing protein [Leptospiraceae bacterium]
MIKTSSNSRKYYSAKKKKVYTKETAPKINTNERRLITVNQTVIRKKIISECQKTIKKIDKAQREIDQFQKIDKPAYDRWIQENFGEKIQKIRQSSIEIQEKRELIEEVQDEAFRQGITFVEAYKIVIEKRKNVNPKEEKEKTSTENENFWENNFEDEEDIFREDLNEFFKRFNEKFNQSAEDFESIRKGFGLGRKGSEKDLDSRLKERYRIIVQKLHPDKNRDASDLEKELWHEAQEAYKQKDLDKLDFIITMFNIKVGSIGIESSVFDLKSANSKLMQKLKSIANSIKAAKKEPSWGFLLLKPIKLAYLKKEAEIEFREFEKMTQTELKEINAILAKWEKGDEERKQNFNRRRNVVEEDFFDFYVNF